MQAEHTRTCIHTCAHTHYVSPCLFFCLKHSTEKSRPTPSYEFAAVLEAMRWSQAAGRVQKSISDFFTFSTGSICHCRPSHFLTKGSPEPLSMHSWMHPAPQTASIIHLGQWLILDMLFYWHLIPYVHCSLQFFFYLREAFIFTLFEVGFSLKS